MTKEEVAILMQRAVDGVLPATEREVLARALKADPLLKSEFEELQAVHAATEQLFRQIALPADFSTRVMRRLQGVDVPADARTERVRLPKQRPISRRHAVLARSHRARVRVYSAIAALCAAAALVLSVGVMTGAFSRQAFEHGGSESAVGVSQGGPGVGGDNRTDPLGRDSEEGEAPGPEKNRGASPDSAVDESDETRQDHPEVVNDLPAVVEKPEDGDKETPVERKPNPPSSQPDDKGARVEDKPETPREQPTGTDANPASGRELAAVAILSGRAEVLARDGNWVRLTDMQLINTGANLRTSANGVAMLNLETGTLVLGRSSEVSFNTEGTAALVSGEVAIERSHGQPGSEIEVKCEDYAVVVSHGCALVNRKARGLNVKHVVGFAYVTHAQIGSLLLDGGLEADVDFGKEYGRSKPLRSNVPDWTSEARTRGVISAVEGAMSTRDWKAHDRRYIDKNLGGYVTRVMRFPVESERVAALLAAAIANQNLGGKAVCQIVGEVENAFVEESGFALGEIALQAESACKLAKDFPDWQATFKMLLHPPQPVQRPAGAQGDCPAEEKPKRPNGRTSRRDDIPEKPPSPIGGEPPKKD